MTGLQITVHFHTVHSEWVTRTQTQLLGACALLTEPALTQGYRDSFASELALALHEWTRITATEEQPSSSAVRRQVGRMQVHAPIQSHAATAGSTDRRLHVQHLWRKCA